MIGRLAHIHFEFPLITEGSRMGGGPGRAVTESFLGAGIVLEGIIPLNPTASLGERYCDYNSILQMRKQGPER